MLAALPQHAVDQIVRQALDEDAPWGDLTSQTLIPAEARVKASLVAREHGILAGIQLFAAAMRLTDPTIKVITQHDAQPFFPGDVLATAEGPARAILQAERVALNFVQRLSGIATLTAQFVEQIKGTNARLVDTRKTTPTLRLFERYAVRCGGGRNHRYSLSDAMLVKDNHLAVLAAHQDQHSKNVESRPSGDSRLGEGRHPERSEGSSYSSRGAAEATFLTTALQQARANLPHTAHLEVEVDHPDQIEPVLAANVDTILLDNFTPDQLRAAVQQIAGRALVEASGNVRLDTVRAIAETGVDLISAGALTHSVRSLDLGLDILPEPLTTTH